jgi:type 1 glutamine amidotransferase
MFWRMDQTVLKVAFALSFLVGSGRGHALAGDDASPAMTPAVRVLIITGRGGHDWRTTSGFLRKLLEDTGRFDVRVCEAADSLTIERLAGFDVIVDAVGVADADSQTWKSVVDFVQSGKGLVVTHGALTPVSATKPNGDFRPSVVFFDVKTAHPDHSIVRGLPASFKTADSLESALKTTAGDEVLATHLDEPVLVASQLGKGRVFKTALGHNSAAMQEPYYLATFARGTEWAATGVVTLSADLAHSNTTPVKGLLITGGHEHEASFYKLFDGYRDLPHLPVAATSTAFRGDLRGKYDVLIMYDFTRHLDDGSKKNLRDFVESGGGVVVLHHALLNYQDWPWWYKEAVGGSYRLQKEQGIPSSTVKDREHFFVTPDEQHPITAHLDRFHLVDEAYKRMWIAPEVRPLLYTDNPQSDRLVAWVGPSAGFRVVAIQLGHGPAAFIHSTYRALVHNAVLWAAKRLN